LPVFTSGQSVRKLTPKAQGWNFRFESKSAFDYQILAGVASLALISSIFLGADFLRPYQVFSLLLANIFSFTVLFVIVFVVKKSLAHFEVKSFGIAAAVAMGAIIGTGKGALTGAGLYWLGIESELSTAIYSRAWQTLILGAILIPVAFFLSNLRSQFAEERTTLLLEKVRRESSDSYYAESLREVIGSIKQRLKSITGTAAKEDLAREIRRIVSEEIRPLSHEIWARESRRTPGFGFRSLISEAVFKESYRPFLIPLVWMVTTLIPYIAYFGYPEGAYLGFWRAALFALILLAAWFVPVKKLWQAWLKFSTVVLGTTVLHQTLNQAVANIPTFSIELIGNPLSNLVWIAELMLLSGIIRVFFARGRGIRSELQDLVGFEKDLESWQSQTILKDRKLAQFLHGHLQARLVATAIQLEQGNESSIDDMQLVDRVLDDSLYKFSSQAPENLVELRQGLLETWSGILEIRVNFETREPRAKLLGTLSEVIDEAITNSLRHGFAEKVSIFLHNDGSNVVLVVSDDGIGPRAGARGLGSHFLDSVALDWALEAGDVGARLRVVFAG
jgi:hypothetical protein